MNKMIAFFVFGLLYNNLMAETGYNFHTLYSVTLLKHSAQYSISQNTGSQNDMRISLYQSNNYIYPPVIPFIQNDSLSRHDTKDMNFKNAAFTTGKQFLIGGICGIGGVFISGIIYQLAMGEQGSIGSGLPIAYSGYTAGSSFGVYIAGNNDKVQGNFLSTLSGGLLGSVIGAYIFFLADQKGPLCSALVIGAPIGSIIGYNLFKKDKHP